MNFASLRERKNEMARGSYYTPKTIDTKARQILWKLKKYRKPHKIKFAPERSALLIMDMQKYFLDKNSHAFLPSALPIIPKIEELRDSYLKANLPVIFTRHINNQHNAKMLKEWWSDLITEDNLLSEITEELFYPEATVIKKSQYDAFYQTNLEDLLRHKKITQVLITGVMTHLCCETTARSAFVRGFKVFFTIDGTATENEEFHWATLLNLSHGFAISVLIEEIEKCLKKSALGNYPTNTILDCRKF